LVRRLGSAQGDGASFRITTSSGESTDLFFHWQEQGDYWRLVTFHLDSAFDTASSLQLADRVVDPIPLPAAEANPELLDVVDEFLTTWLVEQSTDHLDRFLAPSCYACVDLLHGDAEPVRSERQARNRVHEAFRQVAEVVRSPASLAEAIRGSEPWNPEFHLMPHQDSDAYTVVAVPVHLAESLECTNRAIGVEPRVRPDRGEYGDYYAVLFTLAAMGENPPTFMLLFTEQRGEWRVVSYDVVAD
jgi:hypothetical protein